MSSTYITAELRRQVVARADHLCEYCLLHEDDTFFGCEVDHVISEKHGGPTREDNLAYACMTCNRNKGSDIASLVPGTDTLVRFFHPRRDHWRDHFRLDAADGVTIVALTESRGGDGAYLRVQRDGPPAGAPGPASGRALSATCRSGADCRRNLTSRGDFSGAAATQTARTGLMTSQSRYARSSMPPAPPAVVLFPARG